MAEPTTIQYWFNVWFENMFVFGDPYPAPQAQNQPKYSTPHGPFETARIAFDKRRELRAELFTDQID